MTAPSTFCGFVLAPPAARRIRRSVSETQHDLISSRRYSPRVGHGRRALSCVDAAASASPVVQAVVKPRHVGIAGAGIGGVATALALLRTPATGVEKVTLYEPRSELDAGQGAALNLTSGASVLQKAYGLELGEIARPFRSVVAKRADGSSEGAEVLMSVDVERAFQDDPAARALLWSDGECLARTVMREDLQRLLVENLPKGARIVRDSRVTDVVQDGQQWRFRLSDGSLTDDAFDLCIGADGIRSEVRRHILGRRESPIYSGIRVQFCIAQPKDAELETDSLVQWFGDGSYCLQYAAGVGPTARELLAHSFQSRVPADENVRYDQSNIKADCKRRLEAAGMPQLGVIDLIDRCDRFIDVGVYYHKPADTWTDALGGTVLIGDAGTYYAAPALSVASLGYDMSVHDSGTSIAISNCIADLPR